jgi:hypothetical protein
LPDGVRNIFFNSHNHGQYKVFLFVLISFFHGNIDLISFFHQIVKQSVGAVSLLVHYCKQFVLHPNPLSVDADAMASSVDFTQDLFGFGRYWFPMATLHGFCMELYSRL